MKKTTLKGLQKSKKSPEDTVLEDEAFEAEARRLNTFLGEKIRDLRQNRKWSLSELSKRSKIAISTLSKVENNVLSLNYDRLMMVAKAFDLTLSEFLAEPNEDLQLNPPMARFSLAKKGNSKTVQTSNYMYNYLCTNLKVKKMVPILSQVKARSLKEFGNLLKHDGEEFAYVIKGKITVYTEIYEPEVLKEMEGVYLDSQMGHAYINSGDDEAWILSINTMPVSIT